MRNCIVCPDNPIGYQEDRIPKYSYENDGKVIDYQIRERVALPQPYFVAGYTGWTPGSGPQRQFIIGDSSGRYTHELLHDHRVAGSRMNPLQSDLKFVNLFVSPPRQKPKLRLDNPHKALEPYFIPGYTGFTPGSGIRRSDGVGENYGTMTHIRLAKHAVGGNRLSSIYNEPPDDIADREEVKFYCNKHELTWKDIRRWHKKVPGYAGHIPRELFHFGKSGSEIGCIATAEFEKIRETNESELK
ncbi:uncharacterized protein NPIL_101531 [Nephila pilipes]|uniref:Uncharacterized protein n=1 Tax=Nephila pilipes TaxID=299642 RepID=A0A8X6PSF1_NEPPI|nr:uncharacterized protein NPIL_101531 [Nephila pilipes]